ncbi:hypothetical protein AB0I50_51350, partial [Streptomyces prunicolor]
MIDDMVGPAGGIAASTPVGIGGWRAFRSHRLAVIALAVFGVVVLAAVLAPVLPLGSSASCCRSPPTACTPSRPTSPRSPS